MGFPKRLNTEQKKNLASFFNSLAVAWAVAAFIDTNAKHDLLTILFDIANMIIALLLSQFLLKGKEYDNHNR